VSDTLNSWGNSKGVRKKFTQGTAPGGGKGREPGIGVIWEDLESNTWGVRALSKRTFVTLVAIFIEENLHWESARKMKSMFTPSCFSKRKEWP